MNGRYASTLLIAATFTVLAGCGAGGLRFDADPGSDSGSGSGSGPNTGPDIAGIEGSGITSGGVVTALGSIVVNGVKYDLDGVTVTINGAPASTTDLMPGQITIVEGTVDSGRANGEATRVSVEIAVAGPISAVDVANSRITILGQTISVLPSAVIPDAVTGSPLGGMEIGRDVEVSGFADSTGVLHATRIDLRRVATPLLLSGYVARLDAAARTFMVNGQIVDYSGAELVGIASPAEGDRVRVVVDAQRQGTVVARRIELLRSRLPGEPGDSVDLQGWVTRIHSDSDFEINGYRVITAGPGVAAPGVITLDSFVTAEGAITTGGVVQAFALSNLTPGQVWGTIAVDGVEHWLQGVLAPSGEFRLGIWSESLWSNDVLGQVIGTIDFAALSATGNAVLIGENCGLASPRPFCGRAQPVRIELQQLVTEVHSSGNISWPGWRITGSLRFATPAGEQNWPLEIRRLGEFGGFMPSHLEGLDGLVTITYAEFAQGSPVYMTVDGSNRLSFQSAETGCIGNGDIGPHADPAINLYRVTLRIDACREPFTHLNADFTGLAEYEPVYGWGYDYDSDALLRIWVSTSDGAQRPVALSFWAEYFWESTR